MTLFGNLYLAGAMALSAAGAIWLVVRLARPYDGAEQRSDDPER